MAPGGLVSRIPGHTPLPTLSPWSRHSGRCTPAWGPFPWSSMALSLPHKPLPSTAQVPVCGGTTDTLSPKSSKHDLSSPPQACTSIRALGQQPAPQHLSRHPDSASQPHKPLSALPPLPPPPQFLSYLPALLPGRDGIQNRFLTGPSASRTPHPFTRLRVWIPKTPSGRL